jgi:threonine/homoserine/homoserine lactone efflux protein
MTTEIFLHLILVGALGFHIPAIASLIALVAAYGFRPTIPFLIGLWSGQAILLLLLHFFLLLGATTLSVLMWVGIGYLCFIAWRVWNAPAVSAGPAQPYLLVSLFLAGLVLALKADVLLFYFTFLSSFVDPNSEAKFDHLMLVLALAGAFIVIDLLVAYAVSQARKLIRSERAICTVNRVSAIMIAFAAVMTLVS